MKTTMLSILMLLCVVGCSNSNPPPAQFYINGFTLYGAEIATTRIGQELDKRHAAGKLDDATYNAEKQALKIAIDALVVAANHYANGTPWTDADTNAVKVAVYDDINTILIAKTGVPLPPLALLTGPPTTQP